MRIRQILNEVRINYGSNGISDEYEEQLIARLDGLVRAKEKEAERHGRANEHHVISGLMDNEDLAQLAKSGTAKRLKARQNELLKQTKSNAVRGEG